MMKVIFCSFFISRSLKPQGIHQRRRELGDMHSVHLSLLPSLRPITIMKVNPPCWHRHLQIIFFGSRMLRSRSQGQRLRTIEWKGNRTIQAHSLRPIEWKGIKMVQEGRHGGFPHVCTSIKIAMHSAGNFHISKNRTPVHDAHKGKYPMHGAW